MATAKKTSIRKTAAKKNKAKNVRAVTAKPRVTKTSKIQRHLKEKGKITSLEAIKEYGATRLAAIIFNLRHNHNWKIGSADKECVDRYGNKASYAEYTLISAPLSGTYSPKKNKKK